MKIYSVSPVMGVGGAEVVVEALVRDAYRRGHEVTLASAGGCRADALSNIGVRQLAVRSNSRRPVDLVGTVLTLHGSLLAARPDLVHAHNVKASLVARAAGGRRYPIVTTVHGVPAAELKTAARILRWSADRVVAVSAYVAEQLTASGLPPERITIIENTISPLPVHARELARQRLGLPLDVPVVLCAARMVDQKRHDLLLLAWAQLPSGILLLAGDGPNRRRIEADVEALGLGSRVRVLGVRDDVDWLLAAADLVVLPTDWEGLPISLLEAMGAGVPAVASRVGGILETVGSAVRLVEPGSAAALARGMIALLENPHERVRLATCAQELVRDRFGADQMLDSYDALYDLVVSGPDGGRS